MYIYSESLRTRIADISALVQEKTNGMVYYEEFIAIPYFGYIILRFNLKTEHYTIDDLDYYEKLIYDIVGDEFLVDFMGVVYKNVGVNFANQESQYAKMAERYKDEACTASIHADGIRDDAKILLQQAGFDTNNHVWEIQVDEHELALLILGNQTRKLKEIPGEISLYVGEVNPISCIGLMKATLYAKRNHISVARILLET